LRRLGQQRKRDEHIAEAREIVQHRRIEQFPLADTEVVPTRGQEQLDVLGAQELENEIHRKIKGQNSEPFTKMIEMKNHERRTWDICGLGLTSFKLMEIGSRLLTRRQRTSPSRNVNAKSMTWALG
jgi:hypothetical protein